LCVLRGLDSRGRCISTQHAFIYCTVLYIKLLASSRVCLLECQDTRCRTTESLQTNIASIAFVVFYRAALYASMVFVIVMLSVCLSVRMSRMNCDKKNESSAEILTPYERKIHVVFRTQRMLVGDTPFSLKFWVQLTHPASETMIFTRHSLVATQPLDLAKKFNYD